jgi:ribosomal protein S18 acetylase RimI-like enzyme
MAIVIRPYHEPDRPVVRELTVSAFEGVSIDQNIDLRLGPVAGRDWRWRKSRDVDRDIDRIGSALGVAEDDQTGELVGYVTMQCDDETRIGWIHNLVVAEVMRGRGLGRRLIEHALDHFRAAGMTAAKIETLEQNAIGRHLYPSIGFVEVARQIHYAMSLTDPTPP